MRKNLPKTLDQLIFCKYTLNVPKFREKTVYFSDEVFSLGMPSVCPHLTTVLSSMVSYLKIKTLKRNIVGATPKIFPWSHLCILELHDTNLGS